MLNHILVQSNLAIQYPINCWNVLYGNLSISQRNKLLWHYFIHFRPFVHHQHNHVGTLYRLYFILLLFSNQLLDSVKQITVCFRGNNHPHHFSYIRPFWTFPLQTFRLSSSTLFKSEFFRGILFKTSNQSLGSI